MASLDLARAYLSGKGGESYRQAAQKTEEIRKKIKQRTAFRIPPFEKYDPCRLTVNMSSAGISGFMAAEYLRDEYGIDCEMADFDHVVFIVTSEDGAEKLDALYAALLNLYERYGGPDIRQAVCAVPRQQMRTTVRQAMFAKKENVPLTDVEGRTAAETIALYPPGIPVIVPGERIDRLCIEYLLAQGYNESREVAVVE